MKFCIFFDGGSSKQWMRVAINFLRFPNLFPTRTTCSLGGSFALKFTVGGAGGGRGGWR
jgi:hypothetical protein